MPNLITRKPEQKNEPCNFTEPALNEFVVQQVSSDLLRMRCTRFKDHLAALQPPQHETIIRAANFTVDSVLNMIQQNPDAPFIRVYNGIDEEGKHLLFMTTTTGTVESTGTTVTETASASEEELTFADSCCECPPLRNCQDDDLLEPNP